METHKTCCFIGHRTINKTEELVLATRRVVEMLIEEESVRTFAFGTRSEFNDLCYDIVTDLQKQFPVIKKVCLTCRSEGCYLEKDKEKVEKIEERLSNFYKHEIHFCLYDEQIFHKKLFPAGRASFVERNQALIDMSDFCVFYYDEKYLPPERKMYDNKWSTTYQLQSGTAVAFKYAKRKKKHVINMFGNEKLFV